MNWIHFGRFDWSSLVNGVTSHVHDTTKGAGSDRNLDRSASIGYSVATDETFGAWKSITLASLPRSREWEMLTIHSNASHHALTQMLLD